jgi:hypothetical protein
MANFIRFVLGNFTLTFLVIGLTASGVSLLRKPKPLTTPVVVEAIFSYFLLFSIGFSLFYNFVLHSFLGAMTAGFIGWANSPFQAEVGFASLGLFGCWFSCLQAQLRSFAPGNAGVILYMDFLLPVIGFVLLWLQYRCGRQRKLFGPDKGSIQN